ncbi:MAG: hypothetical protein RMA76_40865 [Deltaproteobacteria bacterium]|jgi:hypothetical protein
MSVRRALPIALCTLVTCAPFEERTTTMPAPGRLVRALTAVGDLSATAHLVARGGAPGEGVELSRGDDGVTFSGFVDAGPGEYTLEVVFRGVPTAGGERVFLGRWTSNAFTVSAGNSASPVFSRPLDTIGRPEDGGDLDQDGLGMLDEILWSADPTNPDSDGDGVIDGDDCTPAASTDAFTIVPDGSHEDCDGDGVPRPDLPYGQAGMDCADRDATIFPGATDDCTDTIDSDCNPATCPIDDQLGPEITNLTPADGSMVGCHTTIGADIADASGVTSFEVILEDATPSGDAQVYAMETSPGHWETTALNLPAALEGLEPGPTTVAMTAKDTELNATMMTASYTLALAVPQITRFEPAEIPNPSAVSQVTVEATAPAGIGSIRLVAMPRNAQGTYSYGGATELGVANTSPATFTVDLTTLPDNTYVLVAIVEDAVGNRLQPDVVTVPFGGDDLKVNADYRCIGTSGSYEMPARIFTVGGTGEFDAVTMRQRLDEAIAVAAMEDPNAVLVSVFALGLDADGTIRIDRAASYSVRLQFGFLNPTTMQALTVTWFSQVWSMPNPVLEPDAGNVSADIPIADIGALVDSDRVASAYAAAGCPALTGDDSDALIYQNNGTDDVVNVSSASGASWAGVARDPVVEIIACD